MHVLLDHQLMDMAWSDNLSDCEENLLKVSTHVANTPPSQLHDVYNILLHDREKLSSRFQELSVKSSVSEFVVNSRQLLDINAVRMAAEAILKNEKPVPAQGDHSSKTILVLAIKTGFLIDFEVQIRSGTAPFHTKFFELIVT